MQKSRFLSIFFVFFFATFFSFNYAQQSEYINKEATRLATKNNSTLLLKLIQFIQSDEWDSILVYSNYLIVKKPNQDILDFAHYYRSYAFANKNLFKYSLISSNKISASFKFQDLLKFNKANAQYQSMNYQKALDLYLQIDTNSTIVKKSVPITLLVINTSLCYSLLRDFDNSIRLLKEALRRTEISKDSIAKLAIYYNLGTDYYEIEKIDTAFGYLMKAYDLSNKSSDIVIKVNVRGTLSHIEESRKNYVNSIKYWKEYQYWNDSLNNQNSIYQTAQIEKKMALKVKQESLDKLVAANKLKQARLNSVLIISSLLFLLLGVSVYFYRQNVKRSKFISLQKDELDKLNKTKDQLFSIVSHDLRSSVNALKISNSTLKQAAANKEYDQLDNQLEENSSIASSTYNLLDNLLNWSLLQTKGTYFNQETHRFSTIVDQVTYNYSSILKQKDLEFVNEIPKKCKVFIDQETMKLVIRNLMDNSIKFSNKGGKITAYLIDENTDYLQVGWKDEGKGMSEEIRLKILSDSAQLTKKDHENVIGSGLGMNLVRSMVVKNGGKLDIWSELGKGTSINITLPKNNVNGENKDSDC